MKNELKMKQELELLVIKLKNLCTFKKVLLITKKLLIQSESNDNLISVISKLLVYEDRFFDLIESLIFLL